MITYSLTVWAWICFPFCPLVLSLPSKVSGNASTETMCALYSHTHSQVYGYYFSEDPYDQICILLTNLEVNPGFQKTLFPLGVKQRYLVRSREVSFARDLASSEVIGQKALEFGFNRSIIVGTNRIFFKEINLISTYDQAMLVCLTQGGILPMEVSAEFTEQMSILSQDPITPRFISLAYETTYQQSSNHLVWTLGQTEWKDGDDLTKCPRCSNWVFDADTQWVKINPVTNKYEPVTLEETASKYYCQYMGGNLGIQKRAISSSDHSSLLHAQRVIDGNVSTPGMFWLSRRNTPGGEWISINLGKNFTITNVLFLGRPGYSSRNHLLMIWIGGAEPVSGMAFDATGRALCGMYLFGQKDDQLSGVACDKPTKGQIVSVVHTRESNYLNFNEFAVFGFDA